MKSGGYVTGQGPNRLSVPPSVTRRTWRITVNQPHGFTPNKYKYVFPILTKIYLVMYEEPTDIFQTKTFNKFTVYFYNILNEL